LHAASAAAPASAVGMRIARYEVVPIQMPMHERVREGLLDAFVVAGPFGRKLGHHRAARAL